jgi:hypothetical protein
LRRQLDIGSAWERTRGALTVQTLVSRRQLAIGAAGAEIQTIVGVPWVRPLNPAVESQAASRSAPLLR